MTPVIFRKFRRGKGDIIAIFPLENGTNDPADCSCYEHAGQHGACTPPLMVQGTTLATPGEYKPLLDELVNLVGYDDLQIIKRIPGNAFQIRKEKLEPGQVAKIKEGDPSESDTRPGSKIINSESPDIPQGDKS